MASIKSKNIEAPEALTISHVGKVFGRENILLLYGARPVLEKDYPAYKGMPDRVFERLRNETAKEQAALLSLHTPELHKLLDAYEKVDKDDAKAIENGILLALSSKLVETNVDSISKGNSDAKGIFKLYLSWRPVGTALGVAAVVATGGALLFTGCDDERPGSEQQRFSADPSVVPKLKLNTVEPELAASSSKLLFTFVALDADKTMSVADDQGHLQQLAQGQLLYVKAGNAAQITVKNTPVTHLFYDPVASAVYYSLDGLSYKKAALSDIRFVEGGSAVSVDLASVAQKGNDANNALAKLKKDYFNLLRQGLSSMGKPVDLSWLNWSGILNGAQRATVVMTDDDQYDTVSEKGSITNIVIGKILDTFDANSGIIAHEFTHVIFFRAQEQLSPNLLAGSITQWLPEGVVEALALIIQRQETNTFQLPYGPQTASALVFLELLGADMFLKEVFSPNLVSVHDQMAGIFGESDFYERMRMMYLAGAKGAISGSYSSDPNVTSFFEMPFALRLIAEYNRVTFVGDGRLEKAGILFSAVMNDLKGAANFSGNLYASYGLAGLTYPTLKACFNGGRVLGWYDSNPPFDLIQNFYSGNLTDAMVQRYKAGILLLNSLDYTGMDLGHQQIAFSVLANMASDFSSYWDALSDSDRANPDNQKEVQAMITITEALAIRYGYSFWASISPKLRNGLAGNKIGLQDTDFNLGRPQDPATAYMDIDHIDFNVDTSDQTTIDKTAPWSTLSDGTVTIYLKQPFSYHWAGVTEGKSTYNAQVDTAGTTVTLQFNSGNLTTSGISSSLNPAP